MAIATTPTVVIPADHVPGPPQGAWTDADYLNLPDDGHRYELIDGVLYLTPAAGTDHQSANNRFQTYLTIHVEFKGLGRVFGPPLDVMLGPTRTVQPDVIVILNAHLDRITPRGIAGPPDLVVEIASPSTATYDRSKKLEMYESAGVPEYWLVDPFAHTVEVLVLRPAATARSVSSRTSTRCPPPSSRIYRCASSSSSSKPGCRLEQEEITQL